MEREATEPGDPTAHPLHAKLHPAVVAVISILEDKSAVPALIENAFVRKGLADIQIWLTDTSDATLDALRKLGVTIILQPKTGKVVVGRVGAERLAEIAALRTVRYVAPRPGQL